MITRPIPFSPPMVRATIDGKKSQTRRIVKPQPIAGTDALRDIPGENRWWAAYAGKDPTGVTYRPLGSDLQHKRVITYTLATEGGASLRAAGFRVVADVRGRSWSCPSRPRVDKHPLQNKLRWEA